MREQLRLDQDRGMPITRWWCGAKRPWTSGREYAATLRDCSLLCQQSVYATLKPADLQ